MVKGLGLRAAVKRTVSLHQRAECLKPSRDTCSELERHVAYWALGKCLNVVAGIGGGTVRFVALLLSRGFSVVFPPFAPRTTARRSTFHGTRWAAVRASTFVFLFFGRG